MHIPVRIVLVETSHPGNIGATARAMKTMGLADLRLVRPQHFPSDEATARAAGADDVLASAAVHDDLTSAIADCGWVVGASARLRTVALPIVDPREAAAEIWRRVPVDRAAVLLGPEQSGLTNDDLARCRQLVHIPANPEFSSLNLAMAVQVICYELRMAAPGRSPPRGARQRLAARDGRRARGSARASRAAAHGVGVLASCASETGEAQAAAHLSQGGARGERAQYLARRLDVARPEDARGAPPEMTGREIYLDYAATAPLDPAVAAAMHECMLREFGNPSSAHAAGRRARALVEAARERVAARVGSPSERLIFTSGATESNNLALAGVLRRSRNRRVHLVTSRIEHKSVLEVARGLEAQGAAVTYVAATAGGWVAPERVAEAIDEDTQLVSIMHVNNETGVIQDVCAIGEACRARGVLFHVDAAQSVGKVPLDLAASPIDLCSLTAHKLCGPKGIGALYVAPRVTLAAQILGGEQERRLRAGTLATHQIVGMGKAYELADSKREAPRLAALRDQLWRELSRIEGARQNGDPARRAPHVLNVTFPGVDGASLRFALADVAASAGSACAADSPEASHVLTSIGLSDVLAASSVRFSVGRFTAEDEVATAAERVAAAVARLRALAPAAPAWCSA